MPQVPGQPVPATDDAPGRGQLSSWYTQGASDGFGDRLLMFDNAATGPLELLRVRPDFAMLPDFESRLRYSLDRLGRFAHAGFAQVRAINHLDNDEGLTVVSAHAAGTRLSDWFPASRPRPGMHPVLARWILGELTSAMAALHGGARLAHGALAAERIVVTSDRRVVITDYVFGDALDGVRLPAERLWTEFRLVHDPRLDRVSLDRADDVRQLAVIGISLFIGRRVTPLEYVRHLHAVVEEVAGSCDKQLPGSSRGIRAWLEQALGPEGFRSAVEANDALLNLTGIPAIGDRSVRDLELPEVDQALSSPLPRAPQAAASAAPGTAGRSLLLEASDEEAAGGSRFRLLYLVAAALAVLGVVQGAVIARLVFQTPAPSAAAPSPAPSVSSAPAQNPAPRDLPASPPPATDLAAASPRPTGAVIAMSQGSGTAPDRPRTGTLRIESPIELDVTADGRRVGNSGAGSVSLAPGSHDLVLVNLGLGVRLAQTVRIEAGQTTSLPVQPPRGSLSANAQPWAEVSIDGASVGDTPLANIAVTVGEHEIVFRHPQLGERRQRVVVRADQVARVSASFAP